MGLRREELAERLKRLHQERLARLKGDGNFSAEISDLVLLLHGTVGFGDANRLPNLPKRVVGLGALEYALVFFANGQAEILVEGDALLSRALAGAVQLLRRDLERL